MLQIRVLFSNFDKQSVVHQVVVCESVGEHHPQHNSSRREDFSAQPQPSVQQCLQSCGRASVTPDLIRGVLLHFTAHQQICCSHCSLLPARPCRQRRCSLSPRSISRTGCSYSSARTSKTWPNDDDNFEDILNDANFHDVAERNKSINLCPSLL